MWVSRFMLSRQITPALDFFANSGWWKRLNWVQGSCPIPCQSAMRAAPTMEAVTPSMAMMRLLSFNACTIVLKRNVSGYRTSEINLKFYMYSIVLFNLQQQWTCYEHKHQPDKKVAVFLFSEAKVITEDWIEESVHHTMGGFCCICSNYEEQKYL